MKEYIFEAEKVDWLDAYHVNEVKGELIRCKDCKFATITDGVYGREPEVKYCDIWFPNEVEYMPVNYYCASAERKEDVSSNFE